MVWRILIGSILAISCVHANAQNLEEIEAMVYRETAPASLKNGGRFSCVFKNTVTFGASITHETMLKAPVSVFSGPFALLRGQFFGQSPAKILTLHSGGKLIADYSAAFGSPVGMEQIQSMVTESNQLVKKVSSASVIVGLDAFYWDAAWEYCGYTEGWIRNLIKLASEKKIPLVLGTVPLEDEQSVFWSYLGSLREYAWTPPDHACLASINQTLKESCRPENRCYTVDLFGIIKNLNAGGTIQLNDGRKYDRAATRVDGVHISDRGAQYLAEEILRQLEKGPELCQ